MITVASWNINSIKIRSEAVAAWLGANTPDLLFLQELKCTTETFPTDIFTAAGYHATVHGQPGYNGVAILSREPVELIRNTLPGDESDTLARFLEVRWNGRHYINIYAPNGNPLGTEKFTYKLAWLERLYAHLHGLLENGIPFVIGGDFNIIPEAEDARRPEQWGNDALFQPESRAAWRGLKWLGLNDAFRTLHPNAEHAYTFWDYQAGAWPQDNGIRIDHFLTSPQMTDALASCHIDKSPRGEEKPSDHTVIVATFDLK